MRLECKLQPSLAVMWRMYPCSTYLYIDDDIIYCPKCKNMRSVALFIGDPQSRRAGIRGASMPLIMLTEETRDDEDVVGGSGLG